MTKQNAMEHLQPEDNAFFQPGAGANELGFHVADMTVSGYGYKSIQPGHPSDQSGYDSKSSRSGLSTDSSLFSKSEHSDSDNDNDDDMATRDLGLPVTTEDEKVKEYIEGLPKDDMTKPTVCEVPTPSKTDLDKDATIAYASTRPAPSGTKYVTKKHLSHAEKTLLFFQHYVDPVIDLKVQRKQRAQWVVDRIALKDRLDLSFSHTEDATNDVHRKENSLQDAINKLTDAKNTARQLTDRFDEKKARNESQLAIEQARIQSKAAWELVRRASKNVDSADKRLQMSKQSLNACESLVDECQKDLDKNTEDLRQKGWIP